ncbi:MAG TPA: acyl-ACP--UDP-N-acetylglucosamine O-acyltransferase [Opitutaceae bacterium]|nr:acyl-ACP--UDP-N-acetylglucosamine O-acyltransferase [Opitutaceae bacterium]
MPTRIHPTAIVEPGAELGTDVVVGAFAFVGPRVSLGDGTVLHHHATVEGLTTLGAGCEVYPHACVGLKTQDLKFKGGTPGTRIGDRNVFREFCTIHSATNDGDFTVIGSDNNFLAYTHVAHDCIVGSHVIMSNNATLAGHMTVGNHVVMGGFAAAHQFCRIGDYAMVGGMSKVVQDVPPFVIADGNPAVVRSLNRIGLERAGFTPAQLDSVKSAYRIFYRDGLNRTQALEALRAHPTVGSAEFQVFVGFVETSERGLTAGK